MLLDALILIVGLAVLSLGAEILVRGGSSLATNLGMTPLLVGLTIVAFGSSTPEMLVGVSGALKGQDNIVLGNVVGSNIFNVGFILAIVAVINPITVKVSVIKFDAPIVVGVSLLSIFTAYSGLISRLEGICLLLLLASYTAVNIWLARKEVKAEVQNEFAEEIPKPSQSVLLDLSLIIGGLILLIGGSHYLLESATAIAKALNISDAVIGLTIVAAGTGMPELATSVAAAIRKHSDIAIGNIIGSNIFNLLGILGLSSVVKPLDLANFPLDDFWVMTAFSVAILPLLWTSKRLSRWEGSLLLAGYALYLWTCWPKA